MLSRKTGFYAFPLVLALKVRYAPRMPCAARAARGIVHEINRSSGASS